MKDTRLTVDGMTVEDLLAFHRARFGGARMEAEGDGGAGDGDDGGDAGGGEGGQTFTQADVDKLMAKVRGEERRKASEKFADYDDLKAKAGEKATAEDRIKDLESKFSQSEARALRAEIANAKGLTPSQAKRLVGSTREELEADADELLADIGAAKKRNNIVPGEGKNPNGKTDDMRQLTRQLFGNAD